MVPQPPSLCEPGLPSNLRIPKTANATASTRTPTRSPRGAAEAANTALLPAGNGSSDVPVVVNDRTGIAALGGSDSQSHGGGSSAGSSGRSNSKLAEAELVDDGEVARAKTCWDRLIQQERVSSNWPLWFYQKSTQWKMAGFCTIVFFALGFLMISAAGNLYEVSVSYDGSSKFVRFVVESDLEAPVFMWYELPHLKMNRKLIVSSKDDVLFSSTFIPSFCDGCEDRNDMMYRRGYADPEFAAMTYSKGDEFSPCGLLASSMFTDRYAMYSCASSSVTDAACAANTSNRILLNESDIAHSADKEIYDLRTNTLPDGRLEIVGKDETRSSWLTTSNLMHFQVWSRAPPASHVRNLWAVLDKGLPAGNYVLDITHNSKIWTDQYGLPSKDVIFAESSMLGSKNACYMLGIISISSGLVELIIMSLLVAIPARVVKTLGISSQLSGIVQSTDTSSSSGSAGGDPGGRSSGSSNQGVAKRTSGREDGA